MTSGVTATKERDLSVLARPSGGFAMLAVDQREAMRAMFAEHQDGPVPDEQITAFKLAATRILSPYASAVLVDRQFALGQVIEQRAVADGCGLIAAADLFRSAHGELVGEVQIDPAVDPHHLKAQGVVALKLLVLYRPDTDPGQRIALVEQFLERCHRAGLISIIEPVSRPPLHGGDWDPDAGILAAATELGDLGADLYKSEVPTHGRGTADQIRRGCAKISELVTSPWVVLSSGVPPQRFPAAVELACREGAAGFLAGRAIWRQCIGAADVERALRDEAVPRLRRLAELVDRAVHR